MVWNNTKICKIFYVNSKMLDVNLVMAYPALNYRKIPEKKVAMNFYLRSVNS